MGVAAHSAPNYLGSGASAGATLLDGLLITPDDAGNYPPVQHSGGLPDPNNFIGAVNGLMQGVYAYGGAMLFVEFMSEMRQPRDFIKGMWAAQLFIYVCYMLYGKTFHLRGVHQHDSHGLILVLTISRAVLVRVPRPVHCQSILPGHLTLRLAKCWKCSGHYQCDDCSWFVWQHWYQSIVQRTWDPIVTRIHTSAYNPSRTSSSSSSTHRPLSRKEANTCGWPSCLSTGRSHSL